MDEGFEFADSSKALLGGGGSGRAQDQQSGARFSGSHQDNGNIVHSQSHLLNSILITCWFTIVFLYAMFTDYDAIVLSGKGGAGSAYLYCVFHLILCSFGESV